MNVIFENLPIFWQGFTKTLALTFFSGIFSLVLGLLLGIAKISPVATLKGLSTIYVEILRNTPLTLVFFFVAFVLPRLDVTLNFFVGAVVALTAYTSAFICQAIISGVNSIPIGQVEAARSLGLRFSKILLLIVLPQAVKTVVPPIINVLIALIKNSSIAGGFFVLELFGVTKNLANSNSDKVLWVLVGCILFYLILTIPLGLLSQYIERKVVIVK